MSKILKSDEYIHGGTQKDFYEESERERCNCPLCDQDNFTILDHDRGLTIVKCNNCELIYVNPRVKNAQENYFGDQNTFFNEAKLIFSGNKKHHRDKNYQYEIKKIKKIKKSGKLLDVGSEGGFFLRKAREAGFCVEGVEPSPSMSKIAIDNWKMTIHNSFLENADLEKENYDIITLIDVFEHVTNPMNMLKLCHSLLKKDGIVAIKVPNGDYNYFKMKLARLAGKSKSLDIWDSYEHVVHYSPKTLRKMVESCGFKIKKAFIPLPINPPVWANHVGHYYLYPSPFVLDWKKILLRKLFYFIGKVGFLIFGKSRFAPDLMFIIEKKT